MFKHITTVTRSLREARSRKRAEVEATPNPSAGEIAVDDLRNSDVIIIKTCNSIYSFTVTDEADRSGTLSGGKLGSRAIEVKLLNADINKIRVGSRAMFLIESTDGVKRVSTSTIVELSHQR